MSYLALTIILIILGAVAWYINIVVKLRPRYPNWIYHIVCAVMVFSPALLGIIEISSQIETDSVAESRSVMLAGKIDKSAEKVITEQQATGEIIPPADTIYVGRQRQYRVHMGSVSCGLSSESAITLIRYGSESLLGLSIYNGRTMINATLYDAKGKTAVRIVDNKFQADVPKYEIEKKPDRFRVFDPSGNCILKIEFDGAFIFRITGTFYAINGARCMINYSGIRTDGAGFKLCGFP